MLHDYVEIFAWSYEEIPGLGMDIVVHHLPIKEDCPPVKQKVHRMRPEMSEKIKAKVLKQFNVVFLAVTSYPQWVANVVLVPKKDDKVQMVVDYRDLNRASPKDDFPLPHIDILVDNTVQHKIFSFMDGFSGYNQRLYSHLFGLARVATDFLFYPKGKVKKAQEKPFEMFRGFGG